MAQARDVPQADHIRLDLHHVRGEEVGGIVAIAVPVREAQHPQLLDTDRRKAVPELGRAHRGESCRWPRLRVARAQGAAHVVLAVPVAAAESLEGLAADADELVVVRRPVDLGAVGSWYRDFDQVSDDEVRRLLADPPSSSPTNSDERSD